MVVKQITATFLTATSPTITATSPTVGAFSLQLRVRVPPRPNFSFHFFSNKSSSLHHAGIHLLNNKTRKNANNLRVSTLWQWARETKSGSTATHSVMDNFRWERPNKYALLSSRITMEKRKTIPRVLIHPRMHYPGELMHKKIGIFKSAQKYVRIVDLYAISEYAIMVFDCSFFFFFFFFFF